MPSVLVSSLGLMGASLAAALTRAGWTVHVHHRRPEVAAEAQHRGYGRMVEDPKQLAGCCDLAVICTPVGVIADWARRLAADLPTTVITDVGSVKGAICRELHDLAVAGRFVGSHPMAGSHHQGLEHADPELYRGRVTVVTPVADASTAAQQAVEQVESLWRAIGSRVVRLDPEAHDQAVARASHLPHAMAAAVAAGLDTASAAVAATGFRDTTRVAGGCPDLWADILCHNREAVLAELAATQARLAALTAALHHTDVEAVRAWLEAGRQGRQRFEQVAEQVRVSDQQHS